MQLFYSYTKKKSIFSGSRKRIFWIELNGDEVINLNVGDEYDDLGATFIIDGVDYKNEVVITGDVDTSKEGIYVVTYTLKNNKADIVLKRLVNVGGVSDGN